MKRLVVIKVGTSTLVKRRHGSERLDGDSFRRIAAQVRQLQKQGDDVVLVSSGAVTAGMMHVGVTVRPADNMAQLQRYASIGWHEVLNRWRRALSQPVGGVLLTRHSLSLKGESAEFERVAWALLAAKNIPIINENDVITHEEIAFGDNDTLAATVAVRLARQYDEAHVVILSDIYGVYRDKENAHTVLAVIEDIKQYQDVAQNSASVHGTGGMKTKFAAAQIAVEGGVIMHIAHGRLEGSVLKALQGLTGTTFTLGQ